MSTALSFTKKGNLHSLYVTVADCTGIADSEIEIPAAEGIGGIRAMGRNANKIIGVRGWSQICRKVKTSCHDNGN